MKKRETCLIDTDTDYLYLISLICKRYMLGVFRALLCMKNTVSLTKEHQGCM